MYLVITIIFYHIAALITFSIRTLLFTKGSSSPLASSSANSVSSITHPSPPETSGTRWSVSSQISQVRHCMEHERTIYFQRQHLDVSSQCDVTWQRDCSGGGLVS